MKIVNPATELVIAGVPEDGPDAIAAKVTRARAAQPAWASRPLADRLACLGAFKAALAARREDLAHTLTREMGKPIRQSRGEIDAMAGRIDFFLGATAAILGDEVVRQGGGPGAPALEERVAHEPLGVVANISAWNYPYFVGSNVFLPALATGNAVVYKPSEHATLTGIEIARLIHAAGVPADVFALVIGAGDAGRALVQAPVDAVFFTGSYVTGRRVAEAAAGRMIKVQLELGGKDPAYVCDDADVPAAAASLADGAFYNAGQSCCAVERLYVHRRIHDEFVAAFLASVRGLVMGDPEDERTTLGPVAREAQLAVLAAQVKDAVDRGARLETGGRRAPRPGFFFEPTVLTGATHDMAVMRDESFGPIIGLAAVEGDAEALVLMNDTDYGLTAAVYARDRARAETLLRQVDAGSVYWNCCDRVSPRLPWTGRKHSGQGSTLGTDGIRSLLRPKAWHLVAPK